MNHLLKNFDDAWHNMDEKAAIANLKRQLIDQERRERLNDCHHYWAHE